MIEKQQDEVRWLEFELLEGLPVTHGCFLKHGGVSSGHLASLNLGRSVGDHPGNVQENFKKVSEALSISNIVSAKLCHGVDVTPITFGGIQEMPMSDGVTTSLKDFGIAITQADCQAAIFYDPIHHAIANVHCGWRGSVLDIYAATVKSMKATYGSNPKDLLVCISPSLGPEHAEFIHYRTELPEVFWQFQTRDNYFDFWAISEWQLQKAGVLASHIQVAKIDTYSSCDYFSHRRSNQSGRQATICALK